jgi:hypothetical protein
MQMLNESSRNILYEAEITCPSHFGRAGGLDLQHDIRHRNRFTEPPGVSMGIADAEYNGSS